MTSRNSPLTTYGAMGLFVLLWGSAALVIRWGLDHASPLALLIFRFALALAALSVLRWRHRRWLPAAGTRGRIAGTGLLLIGGYSICYFQSLAHGITPGLLATLLGAQPILTLLLTERRYSPWRLAGLLLAVGGLALVVWQSLTVARLSLAGLAFALAALLCMTAGALLQKGTRQAPQDVLPLQYGASLVLCLLLVPFQPFTVDFTWGFVIPCIWLGLVISVVAQLLLYRLISAGNLVNVTSLFYLVPVVTVLLDYLILGNALPGLAIVGMLAILGGLGLAFRQK